MRKFLKHYEDQVEFLKTKYQLTDYEALKLVMMNKNHLEMEQLLKRVYLVSDAGNEPSGLEAIAMALGVEVKSGRVHSTFIDKLDEIIEKLGEK